MSDDANLDAGMSYLEDLAAVTSLTAKADGPLGRSCTNVIPNENVQPMRYGW